AFGAWSGGKEGNPAAIGRDDRGTAIGFFLLQRLHLVAAAFGQPQRLALDLVLGVDPMADVHRLLAVRRQGEGVRRVEAVQILDYQQFLLRLAFLGGQGRDRHEYGKKGRDEYEPDRETRHDAHSSTAECLKTFFIRGSRNRAWPARRRAAPRLLLLPLACGHVKDSGIGNERVELIAAEENHFGSAEHAEERLARADGERPLTEIVVVRSWIDTQCME